MLRVRPIKVCIVCQRLFRLGSRESLEKFVQRKYCSPQCAGIALLRAPQIAKPDTAPRVKAKPVKAPRKKPVYPNRKAPATLPAIEETTVHHVVQVGEIKREDSWEVAKLRGPSEQMRWAAQRFAKAHGMSYKETLRLWGYHSRTWRHL